MARGTPTRSVKPKAAPTPPAAAGLAPTSALPTFTLKVPLDAPAALATEWLLTDGRGGFAMGTASGVPTRRYHALLIAAMRPPVGRVALLNATVDRLIVHPDPPHAPHAVAIDLSSFRFAGDAARLHPDGASRASGFSRGAGADWTYDLPPARVTRSVHLHRDPALGPAVTLRYVVERPEPAAAPTNGATPPLRLSVRPLVSLRDFHALVRRGGSDNPRHEPTTDGHACRVDRDGLTLHLRADVGAFASDPQWWFDFLYTEDAARGQDCIEDLFSPGVFTLDVPAGQRRAELLVRASIADLPAPTRDELEREAAARSARLAHAAGAARDQAPTLPPEHQPALHALVAAADDFVVARAAPAGAPAAPGTSVIAGYPWFSDWGRDTFISLPGLLLATGRFDEARATLRAFAAHRRDGLIPNVFNDQTGVPEYNTVDGSLWFIQAACSYLQASGDRDTWRAHLAPACLDIINHYRRGIGGEFNIAMDPFDRLITAGTAATQLTWMDARRDGVVFTPRHGKAVEINALWISGLSRLAESIAPDDPHQAANLHDLAAAAGRSFGAAFWNPRAGCLFDVLTPSDSERGAVHWTPDESIRPNQIFAVSLPHSPLTSVQQRAVIECVKSDLLTPRGVRTLAPADSRYRGRYEGNLFQRDGAYHQGTAWPWLLGPLAEAIARAGGFSPASRHEALEVMWPLLASLDPAEFARAAGGGCPGHVAEIFDGDAPQRPQGCPAQAWSAAELLRVLVLIHRE